MRVSFLPFILVIFLTFPAVVQSNERRPVPDVRKQRVFSKAPSRRQQRRPVPNVRNERISSHAARRQRRRLKLLTANDIETLNRLKNVPSWRHFAYWIHGVDPTKNFLKDPLPPEFYPLDENGKLKAGITQSKILNMLDDYKKMVSASKASLMDDNKMHNSLDRFYRNKLSLVALSNRRAEPSPWASFSPYTRSAGFGLMPTIRRKTPEELQLRYNMKLKMLTDMKALWENAKHSWKDAKLLNDQEQMVYAQEQMVYALQQWKEYNKHHEWLPATINRKLKDIGEAHDSFMDTLKPVTTPLP